MPTPLARALKDLAEQLGRIHVALQSLGSDARCQRAAIEALQKEIGDMRERATAVERRVDVASVARAGGRYAIVISLAGAASELLRNHWPAFAHVLDAVGKLGGQ
jgi:hypothetical protein